MLLKSLDFTGSARIIEGFVNGDLENPRPFQSEDIELAKEGFTFEWYDNHGSNLVNVILLSSVLTNIDEIKVFLTCMFDRLYDRNFSISVKKNEEDSDDDEPNT